MRLERVLRGTAATIHATFTADGVAQDPEPDTGTVTLTRLSTGAVLGPYDVYDQGEGAFSHTLSPADSALLETFTAAWTVTSDGYEQTLETIVEVVGGFMFTLAEARALPPLGSVEKYPTEAIVAMRTLVESALEDACSVAFVPRFTQETVSGTGGTTVMLRRPRVTAIRAFTVGGSAGTPSDVTADAAGVLDYGGRRWPAGLENVTVGYEHGHPFPPPRVKHAALRLAKRWLVEGPVDDRATSVTSGDMTYALVTPGMRGALFDLPEVNAVVNQYDLSAMVG